MGRLRWLRLRRECALNDALLNRALALYLHGHHVGGWILAGPHINRPLHGHLELIALRHRDHHAMRLLVGRSKLIAHIGG